MVNRQLVLLLSCLVVACSSVDRPPDPPTIKSVIAGPQAASLQVTWEAPLNSGSSPLEAFTVFCSPRTEACSVYGTSSAGELSHVFTGLDPNTAFSFTVTAQNAQGLQSRPSAASEPVKPVGEQRPAQPELLSAESLDRAVRLKWKPPVFSGLGGIVKYRVYASAAAQALPGTPREIFSDGSNEFSYDFTGLTNDVEHEFSVSAVNTGAIEGDKSASKRATPRAYVPPGASTLTVTEADSRLDLTWTEASSTGVGVDSYRVTISPAVTGFPKTVMPAMRALSIDQLANGREYTVSVEAHNLAGFGPPSSAAGTPFRVPDAPAQPQVDAGVSSVDVSWVAPNEQGRAIDQYVVRTSVVTAGAPAVSDVMTAATARAVTVSGLRSGADYRFSVAARSVAGLGAFSPLSELAQTGLPPDAPTNVMAVPGRFEATVSWTAPVVTGGPPLTGYRVTIVETGVQTMVAATQTTILLTGLPPQTNRRFTVAALNARGASAESSPSPSVLIGGCASGLTECGGGCVNTLTSGDHCGGCGLSCYGGPCDAGSCADVVIASGLFLPGQLAVSNARVYFTDGFGRVQAVELDGGQISTVLPPDSGIARIAGLPTGFVFETRFDAQSDAGVPVGSRLGRLSSFQESMGIRTLETFMRPGAWDWQGDSVTWLTAPSRCAVTQAGFPFPGCVIGSVCDPLDARYEESCSNPTGCSRPDRRVWCTCGGSSCLNNSAVRSLLPDGGITTVEQSSALNLASQVSARGGQLFTIRRNPWPTGTMNAIAEPVPEPDDRLFSSALGASFGPAFSAAIHVSLGYVYLSERTTTGTLPLREVRYPVSGGTVTQVGASAASAQSFGSDTWFAGRYRLRGTNPTLEDVGRGGVVVPPFAYRVDAARTSILRSVLPP